MPKPTTEAPSFQKREKPSLPPLRTYKSDVDEAVKRKKETVASIFSAEEVRRGGERRGGEEETREKTFFLGFRSKTSALIAFFGIATLAIGVGFFFFVLLRSSRESDITPAAQALIFVNKETKINVDDGTRGALEGRITAALREEGIILNNIAAITFLRERQSEESGKVSEEVVGINEILSLITDEMPPEFSRALGADYLYGIHSLGENIPFLIVKVRSYENAFRSLLEWEKTMAILRDFRVLLGIDRFPPIEIKEFADILIKNRDTRAIYDKELIPILYYSFVDRETLVFTTDKITFDEILNRLATPKRTLR